MEGREELNTLKASGPVHFVVLQRLGATPDCNWMLPTIQQFHNVVNFVECSQVSRRFRVRSVVKWSGVWDAVGTLGLILDDVAKFKIYRDFFENVSNAGMNYTLMPKDAVVQEKCLSAILKTELRTIELSQFPGALFEANGELRGSIHITHSRTYGAGDKTRAGDPKDGWRLIFFRGSPSFLDSIVEIPESHKFPLGSDGVQIWGGERAEDPRRRSSAAARGRGRARGRGGTPGPGRGRGAGGSNNNNNDPNNSRGGRSANSARPGRNPSGIPLNQFHYHGGRGAPPSGT